MSENRCICCGEIIPEGRHVCPTCEGIAMGDYVGRGVKKDADTGTDSNVHQQ